MNEKTLNNINATEAKDKINDLEIFGNGDAWQLLCKASSKSEGWMKSTKAMEIDGNGCLVQVTTQQQNPDGSWAIAESVAFAPNTRIETQYDDDKKVTGRKLVSTYTLSENIVATSVGEIAISEEQKEEIIAEIERRIVQSL